MGKISSYARVLVAKLTDVFVVDQTDNGTTDTKSATVEQIGTAIGTLQNFAGLDTSNKKLVDSINEVNGKADTNTTAIGSLSSLTTTNQDSLVDAVNEVDGKTKRIGFKSVQGTTTSGGVIDLGLDYNDYLVISAEVLTTYGTYYCTPVASMADSKTYARVYDENNNKVGNTSVTIWLLYYKHS